MKIRLGTRGSKLALSQTNQIMNLLQQAYPEHTYEIVIIHTKGDRNKTTPLHAMSASGIFVKEIEQRLLDYQIDIAVHSMKDLPANLATGCFLCDVIVREDSRDVLVGDVHGKKIATGSIRRRVQLLAMDETLQIEGMRGNIDTRIQKLENSDLDGIVVAAAAMHRLGLHDKIGHYFSDEEMVSAPCQGAIALEIKEDQQLLREMIQRLCDPLRSREIRIEREYLRIMNGSCHTPIGARCYLKQDKIIMYSLFGKEDGSQVCKKRFEFTLAQEEEVASLVAFEMKRGCA